MSNQYSCGCGYNYRRSMQPMHHMEPPCQAVPAPAADYHSQLSLAMAYVPVQTWSQPLPPCKGMEIGTIFADLYKPFCGKRGDCR